MSERFTFIMNCPCCTGKVEIAIDGRVWRAKCVEHAPKRKVMDLPQPIAKIQTIEEIRREQDLENLPKPFLDKDVQTKEDVLRIGREHLVSWKEEKTLTTQDVEFMASQEWPLKLDPPGYFTKPKEEEEE